MLNNNYEHLPVSGEQGDTYGGDISVCSHFLNLNLFFSAELRKMGLKFETLIQDSGKRDFVIRVVDMSK